jgi:hypothetical protein
LHQRLATVIQTFLAAQETPTVGENQGRCFVKKEQSGALIGIAALCASSILSSGWGKNKHYGDVQA